MDDKDSKPTRPLSLSSTEVTHPHVQLHSAPLQTAVVSSGAWSAHFPELALPCALALGLAVAITLMLLLPLLGTLDA